MDFFITLSSIDDLELHCSVVADRSVAIDGPVVTGGSVAAHTLVDEGYKQVDRA